MRHGRITFRIFNGQEHSAAVQDTPEDDVPEDDDSPEPEPEAPDMLSQAPSVLHRTYLKPKSMYNNSPKPLKMAQKAIILHTSLPAKS